MNELVELYKRSVLEDLKKLGMKGHDAAFYSTNIRNIRR
jgi:hypothetical protein